MRLVDTSAWIEWLIASPTGKLVESKLPSREEWIVPTIVQLELAKWFTRESSEAKSDQIISFTQMCVLAPLTTSIALRAAGFCDIYKLATADAIIYATAQDYGADVLTCDAHFKNLQNVIYLAKK